MATKRIKKSPKPKWKVVTLRLPRHVDAVVVQIAQQSGDSPESVVRVILTMQLMRLQAIMENVKR